MIGGLAMIFPGIGKNVIEGKGFSTMSAGEMIRRDDTYLSSSHSMKTSAGNSLKPTSVIFPSLSIF
jgi:hypothetical protein